jgi:hypothetical protein
MSGTTPVTPRAVDELMLLGNLVSSMSCSRMQGSLIVIGVYYTTVSICSLCGQSRIIIVESSWLFIGWTIGPHHSRNRYQTASQTNFASFQLVVSICVDLPEFSNSNRIGSNRIAATLLRIYSEWMTGDVAWSMQVRCNARVLAEIILLRDVPCRS